MLKTKKVEILDGCMSFLQICNASHIFFDRDVPYSSQSIGAAEAVSWKGVILGGLPSQHCLSLL